MMGIQWSMTKIKPGQGRSVMSLLVKIKLNLISHLSANKWKLLSKAEARKGGNVVKYGKLIRPAEDHNEFAHQIWA